MQTKASEIDIRILTIGVKIREIRKQKKITIEELAVLAGCSTMTIFRTETCSNYGDFKGAIPEPRISNLIKICNALDVPLKDVIT
jgi:transcriptional regulator with XRE-family HTH domain